MLSEQIKKINDTTLKIQRVPKKDLDWFKQYANEEYCGDYGMCLKELISFYRGMYTETTLEGLKNVDLKLDKVLEVLSVPSKKNTSNSPKTMGKRIEEQKVNRNGK